MKNTILLLLIFISFSFIHKEKWDDNKEDWTPLMFAIYNGNTKEFNKLIDNGADVTYRIKTSWELNALNVAVKKNNVDAVKKLVSTKKFKKLQYYFEDACGQSSSSIVIFFISKGVNVNNYSENGHSNLMTACSFGTTEIVQALIKNGAEINHQREVDGITALMLAAFNGELNKVKLLMKNGADKTIKDKNGETAYDYVDQIYPRLNVSEETKNQLKNVLK
ncbi:ankyrin repeat domain-containing protein [Flavobacterium sp. 3HN19-14]|uniref:ankyrin repeat domain-containing protein n=1 Tax=Flavobacterium sp. 3HN19-14 TaxID=3448133 RepID=UPI003EE326B0